MKAVPTIARPIYRVTFNWPLAPRLKGYPWFRFTKFSLGFFGPSPAVNTTRCLVLFGWEIIEWYRMEWHDQSDKEQAEEYLQKWSECEKELRGLRLLQMGDEIPDPELRKLLRDGLGVNLDEGTIL